MPLRKAFFDPVGLTGGYGRAIIDVNMNSVRICERNGGKIMIEPTASKRACALIANPTDARFTDEHVRQFQGCPTIAVTKGGRIFLAWYAGGTREPHIENFNLIVKSDDGGKTWSRPIAVIPSSRERFVHALDIQLFTAPDGRLFIFWVQNDTKPDLRNPDGSKIYPGFDVDGVIFDDFVHAMWVSVCDDPDADELIFSEPRYADKGFLRCKPLVMRTGEWLCFNYDQVSDRYGYSISSDGGATFVHGYGAKKIPTPFDEAMAYEKKNGDIRMFARTANTGGLAESTSHDHGRTWDDAKCSGITAPNSRSFVARTPSGRVLLVRNDHPVERRNMTLCLSDDDGETWTTRCIDARCDVSYPDVDFFGDRIFLTYDRERTGAKEILFASFTEADILDASREIAVRVVSKP